MRLSHSIALLAVFLVVGCGTRPADVEPSLPSLPTYEQFRAQQRSSVFTASPDRETTLLTSIGRVHVGLPAYQVVAALGRPDFASVLAPKESTRTTGAEWVYLLSSQNLDVVNERTDRSLVIYFGPDHRVRRIYRRNL